MIGHDLDGESLQPGVWLIRFLAKVNSVATIGLRPEVERLMQEGYKTFVFDFSRVSDIDSVGIGAFFTIAKLLSAAGGRACIFGANTHIHKVIELAHLTHYIESVETLEQAIGKEPGGSA